MYGRGSLLSSGKVPGLEEVSAVMPAEALMGIRMFTLMSELGAGVRIENGTIHAVVGVRTAWANPDDVIAKLRTIPMEDVISGKANEAAKAIAAAAPGTPFAEDMEAGYMGLMMPAAALGMMAAIAIPTFMQYMKRAEERGRLP